MSLRERRAQRGRGDPMARSISARSSARVKGFG